MGLSDRDKNGRIAVFAAGLLACILLAVPGPSAAGTDPSLTMKVKDRALTQGGATRLNGKLNNVPSGDASRVLTVNRTPYPYGPESIAKTTMTDADGRYSVRIKPELNSRYRIKFSDPSTTVSSQAQKVYVFERVRVKLVDIPGRYRVRAIYKLNYSPEVDPEYHPGRKAFFYFRKRSQNRFKRVGSAKWKDVSSGVRSAKVINLPKTNSGYRYVILGCTRYPDFDIGIGAPKASGCPRRISARPAPSRAVDPSPLRVGLEAGS